MLVTHKGYPWVVTATSSEYETIAGLHLSLLETTEISTGKCTLQWDNQSLTLDLTEGMKGYTVTTTGEITISFYEDIVKGFVLRNLTGPLTIDHGDYGFSVNWDTGKLAVTTREVRDL